MSDIPIFDVGPTSHIVKPYFIGTGSMDWMGLLWRNNGESFYRFVYRFRYYKDDVAIGSTDEKSVYECRAHAASDDEVVRKIDHVVSMLVTGFPVVTVDERVRIDGGVDDLVRLLKTKDWATVKQAASA